MPDKKTKGWIQNLEIGKDVYPLFGLEGDVMPFLFRPDEVREAIRVAYSTLQIVGMSHAYKGYIYTGNVGFSFTLRGDSYVLMKERADSDKPKSKEGGPQDIEFYGEVLEDFRKFLEALAYPPRRPTGVAAMPPAVLLCLPGILQLRCRMMDFQLVHKECDERGIPVAFDAGVRFEEAPERRITMQDVLTNGMYRAG